MVDNCFDPLIAEVLIACRLVEHTSAVAAEILVD